MPVLVVVGVGVTAVPHLPEVHTPAVHSEGFVQAVPSAFFGVHTEGVAAVSQNCVPEHCVSSEHTPAGPHLPFAEHEPLRHTTAALAGVQVPPPSA